MLDYTILKEKKCWVITTDDYTCNYKKYFDEDKIVMGLGSDFDLSDYIDSGKVISHKFKSSLDNFIKMSKDDYVVWSLNRVVEKGDKIYRENNWVIGQINDDLENIYKFEKGKGHILPINIVGRRIKLLEKCDRVDCYRINKINDMEDFKDLKDFEKLSDRYNNFFITMRYFGLENIEESDSNEIIINLNKLKYGKNNDVLKEIKNFSKGDFLLGEFISKRDKFECRRVIGKVKAVYLDKDKRIVLELISSKCREYEYSAVIDTFEYKHCEDLINKNIRTHKNIIFYGPPGTGKTYNIDNEVLKIISISKYEELKDNRKELHNELRRLQVDNKVRFCTFHQSYGYEEFVEGLRPNDVGDFTLEDGLLKQIAIDAMFEGLIYELKADLIEESGCEEKNISNEKKKELVLRYINDSSKFDFVACSQYVLVIDEINRGNISKIFGEAFTLLEEDKRLGSENEVVLKLPYSKEDFTLPPNLHFIGTMNSSDKSIAPIDIALRRRFRFIEIMPDENILSVVDGIDLCKLLKKINDRIEYLYDRDHMIGHAYFIGCSCLEDIAQVILYKIIPLLQEYFCEELDKVGLILGGLGSSKEDDYIIYKDELNPEYLFENNSEYRFNARDRYYIKDEITALELRKIYE